MAVTNSKARAKSVFVARALIPATPSRSRDLIWVRVTTVRGFASKAIICMASSRPMSPIRRSNSLFASLSRSGLPSRAIMLAEVSIRQMYCLPSLLLMFIAGRARPRTSSAKSAS